MSSNNQYTITRDNYEEAFLLYVDNELTADEKKAVDAFVLLHPDLKEELDLLCSTKVAPDVLSFQHKETLFAAGMKETTVDESLLLYIDDELPAGEKKGVALRLTQDEAFAAQHRLLLKTKLAPETIGYPNKKELYRRTEKRIAPYWLRIAAAVLLIAGGTAVWMNRDNSKSTGSHVAAGTPKNTTPQTNQATAPRNNPAIIKETPNIAASGKKEIAAYKNDVAVAAASTKRAEKIKKPTFSKPHVAEEPAVASNNLPAVPKTAAQDLQTGVEKTLQQSLNNSTVTSQPAAAYVSIDAAARTTVPVNAVATTNNEKSGGSVKGFLRKATRFIERRTGIKTVNDDNELLVGTVALKL